jgi:hypothetical protein
MGNKNEIKSSPIVQTHTSYHNSGNVNKDYIGNSGRQNNNNIYGNPNSKGVVKQSSNFEKKEGK